jgi:hypothetical protein
VDQFQFEWAGGVLVVKGTVPTDYLKQLLQMRSKISMTCGLMTGSM